MLIAAQKGHTEICELLLDKGKANIEETTPKGLTALNLAATKGHTGTVAFLLSKGAMVDTKTIKGCTGLQCTPLMYAAAGGHIEVCKLLLNTGKANPKDSSLIVAAQRGYTDVCELLLANGSDLEEKNPINQSTALHEAATFNHESLLQLLLSHKANVNSRDIFKGTPLSCASQNGHLASVVTLLQAGADPLLPAIDGALPIHLAASNNHTEIVKILIEKGGCSLDQVRHTELDHLSNSSREAHHNCHRYLGSFTSYTRSSFRCDGSKALRRKCPFSSAKKIAIRVLKLKRETTI